MSYRITPVEVWAGDIVNKPGMLARVLEALTNAGATLEFVIARRVTVNTSRVFVAPIQDEAHRQAAYEVGLMKAAGMHSVRIDGPDRDGISAEVTRAIADHGINLRGVSCSSSGGHAVMYFAFESQADAVSAAEALMPLLASWKSAAPAVTAAAPRFAKTGRKTAAATPRKTAAGKKKSGAKMSAASGKKAVKPAVAKSGKRQASKGAAKKSVSKKSAAKPKSAGKKKSGTKKSAAKPARPAAKKKSAQRSAGKPARRR